MMVGAKLLLAASALSVAQADVPEQFVELWGNDEDMPAGVDPASVADCVLDEDTHVCPTQHASGAPPINECCVTTHTPRGMDPSLATCGGTRPTGLPFAGRSPVYAQHGIAATSVPLSTMCAIDILKAGGSAVDAAIAANACENVVEPMMNGMGGDLMAQVWHGPTNSLHGYNGAGRSPMGLSYGEMESELKKMVSAGGPAALFSRSWLSAAVGRLVCCAPSASAGHQIHPGLRATSRLSSWRRTRLV